MGLDDAARIQSVRDEFGRMRAHLFEMVEAAGMPQRQESGFKGLIRTITYDSQATVEAALRREGDHRHARRPADAA